MSIRILPHLDDVGCSAGSVVAWRALRAAGVVRSASVMVPCPWYPAAVEDWRSEPGQDLGIHITLNAEWARYRWRPISGAVKGLVDDDGFFHRRPEATLAHADPAAVEDEMAAQIERALADGIAPTHIDAHMGTAYLPAFVERTWNVASRYRLPLMVCRDISVLFNIVRLPETDAGYFREIIAEADRRGDIVFDRFLIGFTPEGKSAGDFISEMVKQAGAGLHWLALHANAPGEVGAFAPHMVWPREAEYQLFRDAGSHDIFARHGAETVNWRDLRSI